MSDEQGAMAADGRGRRAASRRPTRGSADELLDAGAARRPRPDAPLRRPRHGRGRPGPVPGDEAGHRAGHRRRLLLRLRAAAAARRPTTWPRSRSAWPRPSRRTTPSSDARCRRTRAAPSSSSAGPAVQGRDPRRPRGQRAADGDADAADDRLRARPVHRPVPRPARREHRQDRPVQAARGRRRVLARRPEAARCSSASTARSGRRRRSWTTTCGAARRRKKRDHRRLGVQLDLFSFHDVSPGSAFWHPKGWTL